MPDQMPPLNSLVLYKTRPALVQKAGDRLIIKLEDGETARVRPKDVILLHPGPLGSLAELRAPLTGEVQAAWELLAGGTTTLAELAELVYGAFTPATAWAAWQLVAEGLYFKGEPERIIACTPEEVARVQAARQAEAAERQAWEAFVRRARKGCLAPEDQPYVQDIENLALGRTSRSRVLRELGREETQENAHAALLELGYWTPLINPYPHRLGSPLTAPNLPLPPLPQEPRRDLTALPAYAIDDIETETPDDALSLDGQRLWVHVADPAALVQPDTPLDLEARGRGATSHLPEAIIPMLPSAATPLLGLGLAEVSPALSFGLDLTPDGQVTRLEIAPSRVRVTRLTYEDVEARLEEEPFATLYRLALAYQARREARGAVSIELPEVSVKVRQGRVVVRPLPALRSRALVEGAMIMAGEAVASFALQHGIPVPFTTQEPPEPHDPPRTLSEMFALRRLLKRSQYRSVPGPHSGLGLEHYVQVTSPLRRYLDLVVHQQLRAYLRGEPLLSAEAILERIGAVEAIIGNVRQVERLSLIHWTLVYLLQNPSWRGEGVLVEKHGASGKLLIPALGLETQMHLPEELPLDSRLILAVSWVDLPHLDVRFRVVAK
jgi:exoribonuclease-2